MPGLLQRLLPREEAFFDLFDKQADNIVVGAKALLRMLERCMVRWGVTRRIVWAWVLTIPGAVMIGAGIYQIALR
jgi:phosphate/sulfate permease